MHAKVRSGKNQTKVVTPWSFTIVYEKSEGKSIERSIAKTFPRQNNWWGLLYGTERNGTERNDGLNHGTERFLKLKLATYHC